MSHLRPRDQIKPLEDYKDTQMKHRQPDAAILDHERKRTIEVKCLELQDELEERGIDEDEIEKKVAELRERLTRTALPGPGERARGSIKPHETHELAAAKERENERMARAFGIGANHSEGAAFDRQLQAQKAAERKAEREERDRAREQRQREETANREKIYAQLEAKKREAKSRPRSASTQLVLSPDAHRRASSPLSLAAAAQKR